MDLMTMVSSQSRKPDVARSAPASVVDALARVVSALEGRQAEKLHLGPATTDYLMLMVACYGPLFVWDEREQRYEFQSRRNRPEGALEAARDLTARVVAALGGESGASIADVQAAMHRVSEGGQR